MTQHLLDLVDGPARLDQPRTCFVSQNMEAQIDRPELPREVDDNEPFFAHWGSCPCALSWAVSHAFLIVFKRHPSSPNTNADFRRVENRSPS